MRHLEDNLQQTCVEWWRHAYPKRLIFHIPNGGKRNLREAVRLKKQGVVAGVPDLFCPEPTKLFHGLFVELKAALAASVSCPKCDFLSDCFRSSNFLKHIVSPT